MHRGVPRGRPGLRLLRGVPRRISYDKIQDRRRPDTGSRARRSPTPSAAQDPTTVRGPFRLVRRPNEKGHVETLVGHPPLIPRAVPWGAGPWRRSTSGRGRCREDLSRARGGKRGQAGLLVDEGRLNADAVEAFVAARVEAPRVDSCRWWARRQPVIAYREFATRDTVVATVDGGGSSSATASRRPPPVLGRERVSTSRCIIWQCWAQARGVRLRGASGGRSCRSLGSCGGGWSRRSAAGTRQSSRSCGSGGEGPRERTRAWTGLELGGRRVRGLRWAGARRGGGGLSARRRPT